jgi:hypothetical protein
MAGKSESLVHAFEFEASRLPEQKCRRFYSAIVVEDR